MVFKRKLASVKKSLPALEAYSKCKTEAGRDQVISRLTPSELEHMTRCVRTVIQYGGNIFTPKVKTQLKRRLGKHQKVLYALCKPGVSCDKKRALLKQAGSGIPMLLASLIPMAVNLFRGIFKV